MFCTIDDRPLHYETVGQGRPIVFLHGWKMDHRDGLNDFEPAFADRPGWQRLYLDLPGMGRSPAPPGMTDLDGMLVILLRFLDQVIPGRRFTLAGTSAGAYLARGIVHHRTDLIDGLLMRVPKILPGFGTHQVPPFRPLLEDPGLMAALAPSERDELSEMLVQRPGYLAAYRDKLSHRVRTAAALADHVALDRIQFGDGTYGFSFDLEPPGFRFERPALLVTGRQDTNVGYRDAWTILESYPRASFAVLDRGEHGLPIDRDELFRALVSDWLDRVEEFSDDRA
ncbi:MAG TPA: alpha/beta hydrolase [Aliidongia sp.]|uniref:alpha/beta fold hydrolase n=1 Tax=Aliidongia sp. TaxID=1914230 RepID=UPI002DDCEB77|nr:alpha/beta hydrolase [Aliidongia sp.]HEV2673858.1 alpha/beta hydrolase [Aliidongia sp.]